MLACDGMYEFCEAKPWGFPGYWVFRGPKDMWLLGMVLR
jgi:hypothetical protein